MIVLTQREKKNDEGRRDGGNAAVGRRDHMHGVPKYPSMSASVETGWHEELGLDCFVCSRDAAL